MTFLSVIYFKISIKDNKSAELTFAYLVGGCRRPSTR